MFKWLFKDCRKLNHFPSEMGKPTPSVTTSLTVSNKCALNKGVQLDFEINRIVWIDMEMTGLDVEKDKILEVASVITDSNLNVIAESPIVVINQPNSILEKMDEWCTKQHAKSGLVEECINSTICLEEAQNILYDFVSKHVTEGTSPLAGNSVYVDRMFLRKYMPRVDRYLHYRIIDVSTIKELCKRWNPSVFGSIPTKTMNHRSLADIKESIEELKYYKEHFVKAANKSHFRSSILR